MHFSINQRGFSPIIILVFLVGILIGGLAINYFSTVFQSENSEPPKSSVIPAASTNSEVKTENSWLTQTVNKIGWSESWKSFKISYPESWSYTIERESDPESFRLELKKKDVILTIIQGVGDGGRCIYQGDPKFEGMGSYYGDFKEIKLESGLVWRLAKPEYGEAYYVCQDFGQGFNNGTEIGWISVTARDSQDREIEFSNQVLLDEVSEILGKIQIIQNQ